jgi:tetratricopeptide (TPR) repeat protein
MPNDYQDAVNFYNLGVQSAENRDFENAECYFRKCLAIYPEYAEGLNCLGLTLSQLGRIEEAMAAYRQAIRYEPTLLRPYVGLSFELGKQERWQETADVLLEAINSGPAIVEHDSQTAFLVFGNLASALRRLGRLEESEGMFRRAIQINPADAECHNRFGYLLAEQRRYEEAEAEFRESVRRDTTFALGHYNLGVTLRTIGRSTEAKEAFLEAIRCEPDYADAYEHLGDLLLDGNQNAAAVENFRHVLRIDPGNKCAEQECEKALARMGALEKIHLDLRDDIRKENPTALSAYHSILRGEFEAVWKSLGFGPL